MLFRAGFLFVFAYISQAFAQTAAPTFDVASVKPNKTGGMGTRIMFQPGGRFKADNASLKMLIRLAYDVQNFQITGGPSWIDSDKYDVEGKAEGGPPDDMRTMTEEQRKARLEEVERIDIEIDKLYERRTLLSNEVDSDHIVQPDTNHKMDAAALDQLGK